MTSPLSSLLVPLLIALPTAAQERPPSIQPPPSIDFVHAPKITAQMIVDSLRHRAHGGNGVEQAYGYLRGVKDSLPVKWCPMVGLPNLEIDGEIIGYLAKLTPAARQGAAAPLIAAALEANFPCSKRKER